MAASIPLSRPVDGASRRQPGPLGPRFRHSSHSQGADATCVEVAVDCAGVAVRDSKDPAGPMLRFSFAEWRAFLLGVHGGEFELPDLAPSRPGHRSSSSRAASSS